MKFFERFTSILNQIKNLRNTFPRTMDDISNFSSKLSISVITPSFNQVQFLGDCINSVCRQSYKPIEHLVFDPGSNDGSRELALQYPDVTLITEKDQGQSDAINKGFSKAKGDIIAWINSDDCYYDENVFQKVIDRFRQPDSPDIVYGKGIYVNEKGEKLRDVYINKKPKTLNWRLQQEDGILQPALFLKKSTIEKIGLLSQNIYYCMDYEYWIKCVNKGIKFVYIDENFAIARYYLDNKTYGRRNESYKEMCDMLLSQFGYVNHHWVKRFAEYISEGLDGVLKYSGNTRISSLKLLDETYKDLLWAYNTNFDTLKLIKKRRWKKGYRGTYKELKRVGVVPNSFCHEIPIDRKFKNKSVCYTVGPRRWAFDKKWKSKQIQKTHNYLRNLINNRKSDVCVIVGNGPSLKETDLRLLENQDVIISNNIFLSKELVRYGKFYTVVNYLVAEQFFQHINRLHNIEKIIPFWLGYCINESPNTYFIDAVGRPEFSKDIFSNVSWRHTVSFYNLHIAYGLGYKVVLMIGFDHNYKQKKNIKEAEIICNTEADVNHFHPDYFRGKKWQAADVENMENMYKLAKDAFESDGREIINCTVGGKLELFKRSDLETELKRYENQ